VQATPRPEDPICETALVTQGPAKPRGCRTGVEVDPQAIRRARRAAGLSQAQLGDPLLTRQAVQSIEAGRVKPSYRSLDHIAKRLGLPLESLLEEGGPTADPRVLHLLHLFEKHQYHELLERAETLLRLPAVNGRLLAGAYHYAGVALFHLDRAREAVAHLGAAREHAVMTPDPWLMAESLDWEAAARHLLDDHTAADLAREALNQYRKLQPRRPEVEARMLEHLATALGRQGAYDAAARSYRESLEVAGTMRALGSAGRVYHGLAGTSRREGNLSAAIGLMRKAISFYKIERDFSHNTPSLALAKAENDLALLFMDVGRLDDAERLLASALKTISDGGVDQLRPYVVHTMSRLRQMQDKHSAAFDLANEAIDLATRLGQPIPLAEGWQQLGELYEAAGRKRLADNSYRRAIATLEAAGIPERMKEMEQAYQRMREARRARQSRTA
jgi:tetratricopeptide (TPR) repeat protein